MSRLSERRISSVEFLSYPRAKSNKAISLRHLFLGDTRSVASKVLDYEVNTNDHSMSLYKWIVMPGVISVRACMIGNLPRGCRTRLP